MCKYDNNNAKLRCSHPQHLLSLPDPSSPFLHSVFDSYRIPLAPSFIFKYTIFDSYRIPSAPSFTYKKIFIHIRMHIQYHTHMSYQYVTHNRVHTILSHIHHGIQCIEKIQYLFTYWVTYLKYRFNVHISILIRIHSMFT